MKHKLHESPLFERLYRLAGWVAGVLFTLAVALQFVLGAVSARFILTPQQDITYNIGYIINFILLIVCVLAAFFLLQKFGKLERWNSTVLFGILSAYVLALGFIFIFFGSGTLQADQYNVWRTAGEFIEGNYREIIWNHYLFFNPHQLGLVAFEELLYRLFGFGNYMAVRVVNVFCVIASYYALYRITMCFTHQNKAAGNFLLLALFFCPYPLLYCSLVYNDLLGLALSLVAVWTMLEYLAVPKKRWMVASIVSISAGCLVRTNCSIVLVGMIIIFGLHTLRSKKYRRLILPVIMIVCVLLSNKALQRYYEARSGETFNEGIPQFARLVMGLQDSPAGPGWYNNYVCQVYEANDFDKARTYENCSNDLRKIIADFKASPARTADFFYKKYVSQWCDPTLDTFSVTIRNDNEPTPLYASVYYGPLYTATYKIMTLFQFAVVTGALLYGIITWRRRAWDAQSLVLAAIVIGGAVFHMIFEAKARYVFPYFMMEIPYAIMGYHMVTDWLLKQLDKWNKKTTGATVHQETQKS